ncbi:hypothetical protein BJ322DRAFT_1108292 [Thelephora terrestris]|uniref:DUF6699 domain-containing protein n=1 Tax=Thelephora terrestris TaxID=56493 RepID=A0A9P6L8A0_9AGAM|nr:hypothetical protein BJ322DRAFT_1108292 [Thelephora terrestris]
MVSQQRPGPNDATTSTGIGNNTWPPIIFAPVPRRATTDSILTADSDDGQRHNSRRPLPNTPLQSSTPGTLNQQFSFNAIPDTQNGSSPGGGNVRAPHHCHSRNSSWGSARSSLSPSSKKAARFSPHLLTWSPQQIRSPPPRGATPIRSAMRHTPSPTRNSPQGRYPTHSPGSGSVPTINIVEATPPSPAPSTCVFQTPPEQPWDQAANVGRGTSDDGDEGATPGQRIFQSHSPPPANLRRGSPPVRQRNTGEPGYDDSGYLSPHPYVPAKSPAHMPAPQLQNQSHGTGNTASHQNQTGMASPTNQNQPASSSQVNQCTDQQRSSGSRIHTSWQAPRSPPTCSPVIPPLRSPPVNTSQGHTNTTSFLYPGRPPHAVPSPARSTHRLSNRNLAPINTSFGHPIGGQFDGRPRSSQSRASQRVIPHGPARTTITPANGSGNDVDINSVVNDLLRVPPTSTSWQAPQGVLTWTPHPALPNSGLNLLGHGSGDGAGGRGGDGDWWTGGYPMPGACPNWTPGAWPPASASRQGIQLAPWMIPNPCNAALPHIMWDVSQLPTTARRITGNHVIVSVMDKLEDVATHPAVDRLAVACQVGVAEQFWGHIEIKASRPKGVTVWDVLNGIFEYFQKRVGRRELSRMKELSGDERLEEKMADAFYQRIRATPALPGYERKQGLKRVDCLGDECFFWGLYVSYNNDSTWQLNLGLVNRGRYA